MSLLARVKDLIRANVNDVQNKAEDPEQALNHYIEGALEHVRQFSVEVNRLEAQRVELEQQSRACETAIGDWHEKARTALKEQHEDQAKKALEQEQKQRDRLTELKSQLAQSVEASAQLQEQYRALQQRVEEAKAKRDELVGRKRVASAERQAADAIDPSSRFDRMLDEVRETEAQAQVSSESLTHSLSFELEQLEKQSTHAKVDDALAKLKADLDVDSDTDG